MTVIVQDHPQTADPSTIAAVPRWMRQSPVVSLVIAAIILRLLVFLGRGDYVAFDEGWYLLLGRNLMAEEGFTLSGMQHVALSPLFPVLAGLVDVIVGNIIWSGRIVAAIAGGLLVVPCWSIFSRLGGNRTAMIGCALVACVPTLTPFAAAYWIGWDLWVGAEPLLHLALFSGLAILLRAMDGSGYARWPIAGGVFALAYLARPEAIIAVAVLCAMVTVLALRRIDIRMIGRIALLGIGFAVVSLPYWIYLHDVLGHWTITGRSVAVPTLGTGNTRPEQARNRPSATIESMLWGDSETNYRDALYGLDATGARLRSSYWGIDRNRNEARSDVAAATNGVESRSRDTATAANVPEASGSQASSISQPANASQPPNAPRSSSSLSRGILYGRALGVAVPWLLWPFMAIGVFGRRSKWSSELLVTVPIAITSVVIAVVVAADPRTQLLIVPVAVYYAARGITSVSARIDAASIVRPGFGRAAILSIIIALFLVTEARWVYLGRSLGSPHHLVGSANRAVAETLDDFMPPDAPVMSWHPALALFADRDWRVLPSASMQDIVRYANANGIEYAVLSVYYASPIPIEQMPSEYLVLNIPPGLVDSSAGWQLQISPRSKLLSTGRLRPAP